MSDSTRRRLLSVLGSGSGMALLAALPHKWAKPVVDSVVLPAHAQTSSGVVCNAGSIDSSTNDEEGVAIIFDGDGNCSLRLVDGPDGGDSGDPDEMLLIDNDLVDDSNESFDLDGPAYGANWDNGPDLSDQPAGHYSFIRTRTAAPNAGVQFEVSFDVSFSGSDTMTVSNVTITPL